MFCPRYVLPTLSALALSCGLGTGAQASLVTFQSYTGNVKMSSDGFGSTTNSGAIQAEVQSGSTVIAAYLYTATYFNSSLVPTTVTLDGSSVSYGAPSVNVNNELATVRSDVTSIVKAKIEGGAGGIYDFDIDEGSDGGSINGSALIVVYSNPALPEASVGLLDGFSAVGGDATSIAFSKALNPSDPGFFAEMVIGSSHSCCNQRSTIEVNGGLLTENAGNFDDGLQLANGSLITMGGVGDPLSPLNPSYDDDHERYDLSSFIKGGDTMINIKTTNPSGDDNIFFAGFYVSGEAKFNPPPPSGVVPLPASVLLLGGGLGGLGLFRRFRRA